MTSIRSITDLNLVIAKNLDKIAKIDFEIIVGIPRSGLMAATIIATHLQRDVTDIHSFLAGRAFTKSNKLVDFDISKCRILLVDDSINSGSSMNEAVSLLREFNVTNITRLAVYKSQKTKLQSIDVFLEEVRVPRAFQWNLWKHVEARHWATDLDGVLCRDPVWKKENDKGPKLMEFYETADKKFPLVTKINYIITGRLEMHRLVTEQWLKSHNILYNKLIMKSNDSTLSHADYKAAALNDAADVRLYIESDSAQAKIIAEKTSIPVWCTDSQRAY